MKEKFAYGADIGWLELLKDKGITWLDEQGNQREVLDILKDSGMDALRFRVFANPPEDPLWEKPDCPSCYLGYTDADSVIRAAKQAQEQGFRIMIDFHYSSYFADPAHQAVPNGWESHTYRELLEDVYQHTYEVMTQLADAGIYPEWVQVGNEINSGIMLPHGSSQHNFSQLAGFLNKGYEAVKTVSPHTLVVTHLAEGQDPQVFQWFFDQFLGTYQGKTDIIGLSYYPYWVGSDYTETIGIVKKNLKDLADRYQKDVMVCEVGGDETDPENSYCYVLEVIKAVKEVPGNRGAGVFWWEPEGNRQVLPDGYPLGATRAVGENQLQFTKAIRAFADGRDAG